MLLFASVEIANSFGSTFFSTVSTVLQAVVSQVLFSGFLDSVIWCQFLELVTAIDRVLFITHGASERLPFFYFSLVANLCINFFTI